MYILVLTGVFYQTLFVLVKENLRERVFLQNKTYVLLIIIKIVHK